MIRVVIGVFALEVATSIDGLEYWPSVGVLAVGRTAEFPVVTVDDDSSVTGSSVVSIQNEWFKDLHVLNDESTVLKDGFSITAKQRQREALEGT